MRQRSISINIIVLVVSISCLLLGIGFSIKNVLFLSRAISTEGVVIGLKEETSIDDMSTLYRPEVQFRTQEGEVKTFISSVASRPPRYQVGRKVNVVYEYKNGRILSAEINSFSTLWFAPRILIFMGIIAGIISVTYLFRS